MKSLAENFQNDRCHLWQIHEKISSWTAHLLGPLVFNFGIHEEAWNMKTADLLLFPEGSVGRILGEFLKTNRLELIARAESHDLYHVLFDFPTSFTGEVALQFFLRGNGKNSIASLGTSVAAWIILPRQWSYLRSSFERGKRCMDISRLDPKGILFQNYEEVKLDLFQNINYKS